jgi:GNAT superfamily N-acetyltransferase
MNFIFRKAKITDTDNLETLIRESAESINAAYYSKIEIDAALGTAWTVDQQLILDNTYWIVENLEGIVVGCGGWSKRKLLLGKNNVPDSLNNELIPGVDPARIRAFFVRPDFARMGIGKTLLEKCEAEARSFGFDSLELVATLSGEKLYSSNGYIPLRSYEISDFDSTYKNLRRLYTQYSSKVIRRANIAWPFEVTKYFSTDKNNFMIITKSEHDNKYYLNLAYNYQGYKW